MRQAFPELTVPEFPRKPEALRSWFLTDVVYPSFPKYRLTAEDAAKTEQYRAHAARRGLESSLDYEAFLDSLDMRLIYHVDSPATIERASQLSQKTNQFNVTTRRYSPATIARFV